MTGVQPDGVAVPQRVSPLGAVVLYTLSEGDEHVLDGMRRPGNRAVAGQQCPALIVRDFVGSVNLQVFLDGADSYWATSRAEGDGPGRWQRMS